MMIYQLDTRTPYFVGQIAWRVMLSTLSPRLCITSVRSYHNDSFTRDEHVRTCTRHDAIYVPRNVNTMHYGIVDFFSTRRVRLLTVTYVVILEYKQNARHNLPRLTNRQTARRSAAAITITQRCYSVCFSLCVVRTFKVQLRRTTFADSTIDRI